MITLTTDFGTDSPYVAEIKAAIVSVARDARIIDITHAIPPQDIFQAAIVLADVSPRFPPGTIHVAVVDPGVGTDRRLLAASIGGQSYVAADNGVLTGILQDRAADLIMELNRPAYWLDTVSRTFHGRDIMSPVAARLDDGESIANMGVPIDDPLRIDWPLPETNHNEICGEIVRIDNFGNLITNIRGNLLADITADRAVVACGSHQSQGVHSTYGEHSAGTLVAVVGSAGRLELAVVNDSAAERLQVGVGQAVVVSW